MEKIEIIEEKLDKMTSFFTFNKGSIKNEIITFLEEINADLENLPEIEKQIEILTNNLSKKQEEFDELNSEHLSLSEKYNLISKLLSANNTINNGLNNFKTILNNDFLKFANTEDSLAEEAKALIMLQDVERELELVVSFPDLYKRNIVAIGGGFSSGKSKFVSSFFVKNDITLPIGIEPVTAIPSYVISENENIIKGFSTKGGLIDISSELYKKLSHNFVKSFSFNLKDIMPFMMIGTPLDSNLENICFVDTPGYNPAITDGFTSEDKKTAFEFIDNANALIWVVGLDSNGTIPATDLEFLSEVDLENKELFIVANKADLRADSEIEEILEVMEESLDDYDIEFSGISAYSSNAKKEYHFIGKSLFEFFESQNKEAPIHKELVSKVYQVCDMYKEAIEDELKTIKNIQKEFKSLELDLIEEGFEDDSDKFTSRLHKLKNMFNTKELQKNKKTIEELREKLKNSIDEIFGEVCEMEGCDEDENNELNQQLLNQEENL